MPTPASPLVAAVPVAWVSTGGTSAPNYDEFNDYGEIEAIIARNPDSILAVDMPHCAPDDRAAGHSFDDALPETPQRLARLKNEGRFQRLDDVVLPYRIDTPDGPSYAVWAMVATDEISASADDPGRVVRNEDVFADKVRERLALTRAIGHLISAVLLVTAPSAGDRLVALLQSWCDSHEPLVGDVDEKGRRHSVWAMGAGAERDDLLALLDAADRELIVADGNHRSLAAQEGGLDRFLAVVAAPSALTIRPYNRLLRALPGSVDDLVGSLQSAGMTVTRLDRPAEVPSTPGHIELYAAGAAYDVALPSVNGPLVERLDHAVVERCVFGEALGWTPDDPRIAYVGGDYGADWLRGEVDAGRAAAALLIAPVSTEDFVRINSDREKMPRKSTWFTPKARAGLVLAELG